MRQPWAVQPSGEAIYLAPEQASFTAGDWTAVEAAIGSRLPHDYKEMVGDGPGCGFGGELWIASPFAPRGDGNLIEWAAKSSFWLASHRASFPDIYPESFYPEPGGLLGWGCDGGGANYYWDTADADPDRWTVAVAGRPIFDPSVWRYDVGLRDYLEGLRDGRITAAALSGWPAPEAQIERLPG